MLRISSHVKSWRQLSAGSKFLSTLAFLALFYLGFNFVFIPLFNPGDAIIYSRAADWRIGEDVRQKIITQFPNLPLRQLSMGLEPYDLRKGHAVMSAGTAHFYGPKENGCYQLKYSCDYSTAWESGLRGLLQFKPSRIVIGECSKIKLDTAGESN